MAVRSGVPSGTALAKTIAVANLCHGSAVLIVQQTDQKDIWLSAPTGNPLTRAGPSTRLDSTVNIVLQAFLPLRLAPSRRISPTSRQAPSSRWAPSYSKCLNFRRKPRQPMRLTPRTQAGQPRARSLTLWPRRTTAGGGQLLEHGYPGRQDHQGKDVMSCHVVEKGRKRSWSDAGEVPERLGARTFSALELSTFNPVIDVPHC